MKVRILLCALPILLTACGNQKNAGVQDFPNTLQASASTALFDLPTSVAEASPTVDTGSAVLSKVSATLQADRNSALSAYLAVPIYVDLAEKSKKAVQEFIVKLSKQDLPEAWEGDVDSLHIITLLVDSTVDGESARFLSLKATQAGVLRLRLEFFQNDSEQYRGYFFYTDPSNHNARSKVVFNSIQTGGDVNMTLFLKLDTSSLAQPNDPTFVRVHAKKKANGRIVITGASYHPTFQDSFWGNGPRVYGFKSVSVANVDRTVLRVAFAPADSIDSTFFNYYALDQSVLRQSTESLRHRMRDSADMNRLIYFCVDSNLSIVQAVSIAHLANLAAYTPTRTPDDFTSADLDEFLDLNAADILAGVGTLGDLRALYFLVKIHQPLFLSAYAHLLGAGEANLPAGFPLAATAIDDEGIADELPVGLDTLSIDP